MSAATGRMHTATLKPSTKPGKLFTYLSAQEGRWVDAGELNRLVWSNCLSTHIAAARQRARAIGWNVEHETRFWSTGERKQYYRAVRSEAQDE